MNHKIISSQTNNIETLPDLIVLA